MEQLLVSEDKIKECRLTYLQKYMGLTLEEATNLDTILRQPTPPEWKKRRPIRGGREVDYIPGGRFIERFNDAFGFLWSYEVPEYFESQGQLVAKGRWSLQIPGKTITREHPDGLKETVRFDGFFIVKEQFGSSEVKTYSQETKDRHGNVTSKKGDIIDLGDDYKGAATDAMKKCGSALGMFSDVYGPREEGEEFAPAPSQLAAFYKRADDIGKNEEEANTWAEEQLGKSVKKASQQEILGLVADLIDMANKQK